MKCKFLKTALLLLFIINTSVASAQGFKIDTSTYKYKDTYYPNPKDKSNSYKFSFAIDYFKNAASPSIYAVINSELLHYFSLPNTHSKNFEAAVKSIINAEIKDYKKYYNEAKETATDYKLQYTLDMKLLYQGNFNGVLGFVTYFNTYTGGVHPMDSFTTLNFSERTGKQIHLEDIMKPGFEKKLPALILTKLDREVLFNKNKVDIPTEFTFKKTGIEFIYNRYEVASYADGPQYAFLSYKELEHLLKDEYLK